MEGQGVVAMDHPQYYNGGRGNLVNVLDDPVKGQRFAHLRDEAGNWTVRDDVKIVSGDRSGPLTIGYTSYGGSSHIGPELEFGHVTGDYYDEPVVLVKTAWGGKSLFEDFRPPSAGGTTGGYYSMMIAHFRSATGRLGQMFGDLAGMEYELAGFVWMQGWNDMCTPEAIPEYADNLVHLVGDIRREFGKADLPVVIGELGNGGPDAKGNMAAFRVAQKTGAERIENAAFVVTHGFARPAQESPNVGHGHHWFGNAESYLLIGEALGKAMVELVERK